ncbi:hypothetical protein F5Y14DRAFT_81871 [Nemania sp. NC0429]|nr:hypothetical protein F5Y14DRAFT_81871 [Nemania sp. NC0429]
MTSRASRSRSMDPIHSQITSTGSNGLTSLSNNGASSWSSRPGRVPSTQRSTRRYLFSIPNSRGQMTIQMRGIVNLHDRIKRPEDLHGTVFVLSVSHDDTRGRIHAYYLEINGVETTYCQVTLKELMFRTDYAEAIWASHHARCLLDICLTTCRAS